MSRAAALISRRCFISAALVAMLVFSSTAVLILPPAPNAVAASSAGSCAVKGTVETPSSSSHTGDILITKGETMVIVNRRFQEIGNIIVDGGTLIVRDSTITGHGVTITNWVLENGGCMEFTNAKDWVLDDLWLGPYGNWNSITPDNSTLFVTNSTLAISVFILGSNTTISMDNTIMEGFIQFTNGGPLVNARVDISNSVVKNLGLALGGGVALPLGHSWPPSGSIDGLVPGHFSDWDLNKNQPGFAVPYDMTLRNVTLLSNPVGPSGAGMTEGLGWSLLLTMKYSCCFPPTWPLLNISNSRFTALELNVGYNLTEPLVMKGIPSASPVNMTLFQAVNLANTTVDAYLSLTYNGNGNLIFDDSGAVGLWATGKVNVTFVNSRTNDLNPWGCACTFTFTNSSWGLPSPTDVAAIPYLNEFPNASNFWAKATTYGFFINSTVSIRGNLTSYPWQCPGVCDWQLVNATVSRLYPVTVDYGGAPVAGANVTELAGGKVVWRGVTGPGGQVEAPVTYDHVNATAGVVLEAAYRGASAQTNVDFTTQTPAMVLLSGASTKPSSSTSTATSSGSTEASATGSGGGVPEFPYQMAAVVPAVAVLVAAYLIARRRPGSRAERRAPPNESSDAHQAA